MEITYPYQRIRKEFGRPVTHFTDKQPELLEGFPPEPSLRGLYHEKNPTQLDLQSIAEVSEKQCDTERFTYNSVGIQHLEGGWPKDIDPTEKEHTARFRKKVEKDDEYSSEVRSMGSTVEHYIKQNNAIDIYQEYFTDLIDNQHSQEPPGAKTLSVFKDPQAVKRSVTSISWHPDGGRKIGVSFAIMQFQDGRMSDMSPMSYIWDVTNPNLPEQELLPPSPVCCIKYNPKDPHLLVGGCYNGMVAHWDTRKGSQPVDTSKIELSHQDPVYDIEWLQAKTAYECASVSTDGQVIWWDTRKLAEPTLRLPLDKSDGNGQIGGVALEYSAAGGPTKFMVGTEQGMILSCNKPKPNKPQSPNERIGTIYTGHHGPVYSLQRNPHMPKYFISIGDWTVRFWNEEIKTPIMTSKYHRAYILDCEWSPQRPGVFFTCKMDGTLDIWDYMTKQNDPVLQIQVDDDGLQCIEVEKGDGRILATGSVDGSICMMQLSDSLSEPQPDLAREKAVITGMFDRETKREKNLEARVKELKKKEVQDNQKAASAISEEEIQQQKVEAEQNAETAFWECIKKSESKE